MSIGKIFIITGPSCAGKTSVSERILASRSNTKRAVSITTRHKRDNEINGRDYFFVSIDEFKKMILEDKFIEFAEVYGNYYGTTKESFNQINEGFDVIKDIDVQGALKIKELNIHATFFFLVPKEEVILFSRMKSERGDYNTRLEAYYNEIKFKDNFDYYIDTSGNNEENNIEGCANKVKKIIDYIPTIK